MKTYRSPIFGNMPPVITNFLIINILLFISTYALEGIGVDLTRLLALHDIKSPHFRPYQFVTHMFMHANITHIFFNMFALYVFGRMLEVVWSGKRFLIYYFITGLGAAALHSFVSYISLQSLVADMHAFENTPSPDLLLIFIREHLSNVAPMVNEFISAYSMNPTNPEYIQEAIDLVNKVYELKVNIPTVGASGAVFGVLLAFGMLFPNTQLMLLFPPIPIRAKYLVIAYGLIELFAVIIPRQSDNVAHFAHLGGMIFGYFLIKYWNNKGIGKYDSF